MRKLLFLLPVILLLFNQRDNSVLLSNMDYIAYSDTMRIAVTDSGYIWKSDADLATARNAISGTATKNAIKAGSRRTETFYEFVRGAMSFTGIPEMASIDSAEIRLDGSVNLKGATTADSLFDIFSAPTSSPLSVLGTSDYIHFDGWQATGAYNGQSLLKNKWNTATYTNLFNKLPLNQAGLDSIKAHAGGTLRLMMLDLRQVLNNYNPAGTDTLLYSFTETTSHLWISYTPASTPANENARGQVYPAELSGGRKW